MKKQKKISMMRLMMISSQLLLSLFLGYWLFSQFAEKKKLLVDGLERGLRKSETQVIDSMLSTHLINPILNDSAYYSAYFADTCNIDSINRHMKIGMSIDSIPHMMMHFSGDQSELLENPKLISQIEIIDSSNQMWDQDMHSTITIEAKHDTSNQILIQGVKLLINSVGKFDIDQNNVYSFFASNTDTVLLTKIFNEFIEKDYSGFKVLWRTMGENETDNNSLSGILLRSHLFDNPYGVIISGHKIYLFKSISPQIAFALILLLITGLAFRMAFINLKNQRRLMTIKNEFISNITHELKTPVSTVKVALEALLDFNMKEDPKLTKEYLEMAHSEMNRLDLLVNQVLNNSALEDGNSFIFPEETDLVTLVNEALFGMQARFHQQNAAVTFNPPKDEILVEVDKLHLHGVIVNLMDNSLKYCDQTPEIIINISKDNQKTKLSISDNGIGIPTEYIDRIFDKFFRIPKGDKHNVKGYGLGLNYAALVMEHHHGKIDIDCNKEGGCTFTLCLPNKQ